MTEIKLPFWQSILVYILAILLISFTLWNPQAQALGEGKNGGRGPCASPGGTPFTAIVENKLESTVEAYPTFWFYLPPAYKSKVKLAKFVILDESKHPVLNNPIFVQFPETPGIAEFRLPSREGKSLEVGKQYSWYFSLICDVKKPSRNPELSGQIQRVAQGSENSENPTTCINSGNCIVWYDTLTQLIRNRNKYLEDWKKLLQKLELSEPVAIAQLQPLDSPPRGCQAL